MIALLTACTVLTLVEPDLVEEPLSLDIGLPPPCDGNEDCFPDSPLCNTNTGECVQCLGPEHCDEGWTCTDSGSCRDACEVDADCEGLDGRTLCDPEIGLCVQCLGAEDCLPEQYCDANGWCLADFCTPGETLCQGAAIVQCLEDGGSTMEVQVCEGACEDGSGTAECVAAGSTGEPGGTEGGGAGTGVDGSGGAGEGTSGEMGPATDEPEAGGCACRAAPGGRSAWGWLVVLAGVLGRRRGRGRRQGRGGSGNRAPRGYAGP